MESSRGGPLTTFIMMLPLIVVPAIAMLKPADLKEGWVSRLLSASDAPATSETVGDAPEFKDAANEFDELFEEVPTSKPSQATGELDDGLFREAVGESLLSEFPAESASNNADALVRSTNVPESAVPSFQSSDESVSPLLGQLERMGATRTLWFTPGNQMVGFIAFFRADRGMVSYRFESIARSQSAALQDVIQQVAEWQRNQAR